MQRTRRRLLLAAGSAGVALLAGMLIWVIWPRERASTGSEPARALGSARAPVVPPAPRSAHAPATRGASPTAGEVPPRALREARLARAEAVLKSYLESTKYPPTSRPLREQPDQFRPHEVPVRRLPLARPGEEATDAQVILRQDRYYLAGDETVTFTVECGTGEGPAPCDILSATAAGKDAEPRVPVGFSANAGRQVHTAVLAPARQGFAHHHGPIHVLLQIRIGEETGGAGFDVEYTPRPPARLTGRVHERLEDGSVVLGLEIDVTEPGRYVIAARVDDASGRSFAYLSFNDVLPAGRTEAPLVLFGKLVLDEQASAPFRLRDVEGFLLKEDAYPDRELLATLEGLVHTTKPYQPAQLSADEWHSEQRDRYVNELQNDVDRARAELEHE